MSTTEWDESELEHLKRCPVCATPERHPAFTIGDRYTGAPGSWNYFRCDGCGAYYIDPRPNRQSIGRLYEHYFTHAPTPKRQRRGLAKLPLALRNDYLNRKYGHRHAPALRGGYWFMYLLPPWLRWEWDYKARHLPKPNTEHNRLLDVGCGNGEFLVTAQGAGWDCAGVDFDPKAIRMVQDQGLEAHLGALEDLQLDSESFDVIMLSHIIEHVHDPKALLAECNRLLRPGGILWLATPNADSLVRRHFGENWLSFEPHHLVLFSSNILTQLLESMDFSVRFQRRGAQIQAHWQASKACQIGLQGNAVYSDPFLRTKFGLAYQPLELLVALFPRLQGDIVLTATKA